MSEQLDYSEIIADLPTEGLFRKSLDGLHEDALGLPWMASPQPFVLSKQEVRMMKSLGPIFDQFYQVSDQLYRASGKEKLAPWLAPMLDAGKPEVLIAAQNDSSLSGRSPQVIRPDLMLTEHGYSVTELDSVPGGMGVTAWLSQLYAQRGWDVLGGGDGMIRGFASLFEEGADIVISEESSDYKPEMLYFARVLGEGFSVYEAESYQPDSGRSFYRFFELFDGDNIPFFSELCTRIGHYAGTMTPPFKPHFEEKLWLALFHLPGLQSFWKSRLRSNHYDRLKEVIPYSWILDPAPLPPQAAYPFLNLHSWDDVKSLSQKDRQLVAKISGFSEWAWGARGVYVGHDLSAGEWGDVIQKALDDFQTHPWVLQKFVNGRIVEHPYYDSESGELRLMKGRVRLCPYYFKNREGYVELGGCLATIVPADKKKIHGMKDAILVPCIQV